MKKKLFFINLYEQNVYYMLTKLRQCKVLYIDILSIFSNENVIPEVESREYGVGDEIVQ